MRNWNFKDWLVFTTIALLVFLIGWVLFNAIGDTIKLTNQENQDQRQEQQFANVFYDQCMKAHGVYDVGSTGYVCFGNGSVLFQSGSTDATNNG